MENKKLKNLIKLSSKVSIYVPSTQQTGEKVTDRAAAIDGTCKLMAELFGGCTHTHAIGTWILENGKPQNEHIEIVYSYAKILYIEKIDKVIEWCEELKRQCNQEVVSLEVNGELYFI